MDEFVVTANHQVEKGGRMYAPRQVVPGIDPKDPEDALLIEHGLLTKVDRPTTTRKTSPSKQSSPDKGEEAGT